MEECSGSKTGNHLPFFPPSSPPSNLDLAELEFFESSPLIRAATAPSRPLSDLDDFRLSKRFTQLEQAVICSNQLLHKSFDKFDLDTPEGQEICQKYLTYVEHLCTVTPILLRPTTYRLSAATIVSIFRKHTKYSTSKVNSATSLRSLTAPNKVLLHPPRLSLPLGQRRKVFLLARGSRPWQPTHDRVLQTRTLLA